MTKCWVSCLLACLFLGDAVPCGAQTHFFTSVFGGMSNYRGDLGGKALSLSSSRPVSGVGAIFELNHRMLIRAEMNYGKIAGTDKYDLETSSRNLSFTSRITEFSLVFEYLLFDLYEYDVSPYFFAGVGTFKFSPYTTNKAGNIIFLAEQSTEGQGFYQDRKEYKLQELALPFGGGVQWALSANKRLAFEVGIRKTFTDYLDDVSTTYVSPVLLAQNKGGTAVTMAYRGAELPNAAPYPAEGSVRGNPNNKDWYVFTGLSFRISLQPKGRARIYHYKSTTAPTKCPTTF